MSQPSPHAHYLRTAVETASPLRQVVMLYDGAIRFLSQAIPEMRAHNYEAQGRLIVKAQAIIAHLKATLDLGAGGAVAQQVDKMYVILYDTLTDANIHDRPERVEQVIEALRELRGAWIEVERQCRTGQTSSADAGAHPELVAA